ncbi:hypothetical protein [Francisella philomiragia]|uniref:hypothetical protein n=1 Tax=Francisella philomiragia TaxID=28110 RepID=UPI001C9D7498|nr:hypothetical protein [Francisella philomiragia]MBY7733500.1 hypothetical protein [Francisella philomiragia]
MSQNKKINFSIGGSIGSSFSNSIGGAIKRLDYLARKEEDLRSKQTLIGKFYSDQKASGRLVDTLKTQKASLADLQASYNATGSSSEKLRLKIDTLKSNILETTKELRQQKNASRAGARELKKAGIDTNNLRLEEKRLKNELENTDKRMQRRSRNFRMVGSSTKFLVKGFMAVTTAAIGATTAAFKLTSSTSEHAYEIDRISKKLGIATTEYQKLRYAANVTGTSFDKLDGSLEEMQIRLSDAILGDGQAVEALEQLGLSATELHNLSPEKSLGLIADGLAKIKNERQKIWLVDALFGGEGVDMIKMLEEGSEGLKRYGEEAEKAGYILGSKSLNAARENKIAYQKMNESLHSVVYTLGNALMPAFTDTFNDVTKWLSENKETVRGWGETAKTVFSAIGSFAVAAGKVTHSFFSGLWRFGEKLGGWAYETVQFFKSLKKEFLEFKALFVDTDFSYGKGNADRGNKIKSSLIDSGAINSNWGRNDTVENSDILKKSIKNLSKQDTLDLLATKDIDEQIQKILLSRLEQQNTTKPQKPQFASMSDVAKQAREQRANNVTNDNKSNNVQLHNTITIQGNASPKEMEEAIRRATMPLYGNALVGW